MMREQDPLVILSREPISARDGGFDHYEGADPEEGFGFGDLDPYDKEDDEDDEDGYDDDEDYEDEEDEYAEDEEDDG